jgi:hypothetical protein
MSLNTKIIIVVAISAFVVLGAYLDGTPLIDIPNLFN